MHNIYSTITHTHTQAHVFVCMCGFQNIRQRSAMSNGSANLSPPRALKSLLSLSLLYTLFLQIILGITRFLRLRRTHYLSSLALLRPQFFRRCSKPQNLFSTNISHCWTNRSRLSFSSSFRTPFFQTLLIFFETLFCVLFLS